MKYPKPTPKPKGFPEYTEKECLMLIANADELKVIDFLKRKGVDCSGFGGILDADVRRQEIYTRGKRYTSAEFSANTMAMYGADSVSGDIMKLIKAVRQYFKKD